MVVFPEGIGGEGVEGVGEAGFGVVDDGEFFSGAFAFLNGLSLQGGEAGGEVAGFGAGAVAFGGEPGDAAGLLAGYG